ncbi:hypothetical protein E2F48_03895 [Arthrobacter crusticola]|uniref:histidine kinase n=2 Tax=Arthrobacter crusticola TaxID=2547960 RepID=A0A4R5U3X1_9MICC|nr:hypothetical protein E2F48_03895 [Arthrobacter crusticola]
MQGLRDKFRQLADAFDQMLGRLEDAFGSQERFAASASHKLRTPLTVIKTLLDVAQREPDEPDYPLLIEPLVFANNRAILAARVKRAPSSAAAIERLPHVPIGAAGNRVTYSQGSGLADL